jgi:hypothetical protein
VAEDRAAAALEQWPAVRSLLAETCDRFVTLLRTVRDPNAVTTGDWRIADTAAHTTVVCALDAFTATFGERPFPAREVLDLVDAASIDDVARLNAVCLERFAERDLGQLADQIGKDVEAILRATADSDGTAVGPWLGGAQVSVAGMLAHLINELLLHGLDIARAERRAWPVPPQAAALTFQVFFVGVLRGDTGRLLEYHDPAATGVVRVELRSRYHAPVRLNAEHGRLRLGEPGDPVDVRIWSDPTALMLMIWGRSGRIRPVLTGRMAIWGRRPWRVFRFLDAVRLP